MTSHPIHRRLAVISDSQAGRAFASRIRSVKYFQKQWEKRAREQPKVVEPAHRDFVVEGGYIDRLPLACLKVGIVDAAEIWTHWRGDDPPETDLGEVRPLLRRSFQMNGPEVPFASNDMLAHILTFGPPDVLCVWGLGVSEDILAACKGSYLIYNSIDAPALRIPPEISRHFDLVLTGAKWQSDEVTDRHPGMKTAILPIGPEFASDSMFYPYQSPKPYDVIYVAAAQSYKRHDILFEALAKLPPSYRALCVFGHGEMSETLRAQARDLQINVDFVGPPSVPFTEINRLMNQAKIGVVCGVDDGAPAILTEYMLAGLPVLANSALRCGLQYITSQTGRVAAAGAFHEGILEMLSTLPEFSPRQTVLDNWTWPHSVRKLRTLMDFSAY
ncbi:glycosyltransferase [Sinorhizobium medicae]|uniref:Glycosyl transferase group 1 n=1 Tax=Sinorhizobium medicae (strain WSM419) TaxID=366394 RepID=A6UL80_SINMW|nr:glycosyltransferase [Sinorhizobium medicae]ABR64410.1 glycosyl transferase group 1 [Sinorhizobium medicae WSM419]